MDNKHNQLIINKINKLASEKKQFLFIIDFEMLNPIVIELSKINPEELLFNFNDIKNYNISEIVSLPKINFIPLVFEDYKKAFDYVKKNILLGNSYLTNLTYQTELITNLSLKDIFFISKAKYKLLYKNRFTFFSPEIFIQINKGKIFSFPMKGTIDADLPNAESQLLQNKKETAEHYTIVDLIRNDLNIVAKNVKVDKFRYIDKISSSNKNLLQMSSQISGDLPADFYKNLGEIIFSLLPAGSISGAPKKKTVQIIKTAENYKRGYYTGIAGIFDGENIDSCVMIRFIERKGNKLFYKSGGGITFQSEAEYEYQELLDKIYIPWK